MLEHLNKTACSPKRVVVLGSKGFVGAAVIKQLELAAIPYVGLCREQIDFCSDIATSYLLDTFQPGDAIVIAAAKAPVKNNLMLLDNIIMMKNICAALSQSQHIAHVVYISSDAVYQDSMQLLSENSFAAPTSLHGVMHLAREQMLSSVIDAKKVLFVRPTLIYGADDPHNGYGPNQFYRLAKSAKPIKLFGEGEELRDHIHIDDVAKLVALSLQKRSYGVINAVTGQVVSFADIADKIKRLFDVPVVVESLPRSGPMPHNGYRAFNVALCQKVFPDFKPKSVADGLDCFVSPVELSHV